MKGFRFIKKLYELGEWLGKSFWTNKHVQKILLMDEDKKERNLRVGKYTAIGSELLAWVLFLSATLYKIPIVYGLLTHGVGFHYGTLVYAGNKYLPKVREVEKTKI